MPKSMNQLHHLRASRYELHIEQGGELERAQIPIGIVEGIVTIDDYDVHVRGFAADPERYLVPVFEASRSTSSGRPSTSR